MARSCCCDLGPVRRPLHILFGSNSSTAWTPSTLMAGRRLLPPCLPATCAQDWLSFCWRKVCANLQAFEPQWRPFSSDAVCSRCCSPSGAVPGGAAVDRGRMRLPEIGGEGAGRRQGLDCCFHFCSSVFCAKVKGQVIIVFISVVHYVKCTSPMMN